MDTPTRSASTKSGASAFLRRREAGYVYGAARLTKGQRCLDADGDADAQAANVPLDRDVTLFETGERARRASASSSWPAALGRHRRRVLLRRSGSVTRTGGVVKFVDPGSRRYRARSRDIAASPATARCRSKTTPRAHLGEPSARSRRGRRHCASTKPPRRKLRGWRGVVAGRSEAVSGAAQSRSCVEPGQHYAEERAASLVDAAPACRRRSSAAAITSVILRGHRDDRHALAPDEIGSSELVKRVVNDPQVGSELRARDAAVDADRETRLRRSRRSANITKHYRDAADDEHRRDRHGVLRRKGMQHGIGPRPTARTAPRASARTAIRAHSRKRALSIRAFQLGRGRRSRSRVRCVIGDPQRRLVDQYARRAPDPYAG